MRWSGGRGCEAVGGRIKGVTWVWRPSLKTKGAEPKQNWLDSSLEAIG